MRVLITIFLVAIMLLTVGCGDRNQAKAPELSADAKKGKELTQTKGCIACHSVDGKKMVGPTFKGVYGKMTTVTDIEGKNEKQVKVDDAYIIEAIKEPNKQLVKGYAKGTMVLAQKVSDDEIKLIIAYLKELK